MRRARAASFGKVALLLLPAPDDSAGGAGGTGRAPAPLLAEGRAPSTLAPPGRPPPDGRFAPEGTGPDVMGGRAAADELGPGGREAPTTAAGLLAPERGAMEAGCAEDEDEEEEDEAAAWGMGRGADVEGARAAELAVEVLGRAAAAEAAGLPGAVVAAGRDDEELARGLSGCGADREGEARFDVPAMGEDFRMGPTRGTAGGLRERCREAAGGERVGGERECLRFGERERGERDRVACREPERRDGE
jgi:hypothetical protein